MTATAVDATAVEEPVDEPGVELAIPDHPAGAATAVIQAYEPREVLEKASAIATALKDLIEQAGLAVDVGGRRKHVEVGGWQALGAMLGALGGQPLHAETVWTRPVADADGTFRLTTYHVHETRKKWTGPNGQRVVAETVDSDYDVEGLDWEAKVEIRTPGGVCVGSAEAMCSRAEPNWAQRPDPAVRSMAETRAESRAYRRAAGWIVNIAGYSPTPAEEMGVGAGGATLDPAEPQVVQASSELAALVANVVTYLHDGDQQAAQQTVAKITENFDGALPRDAGQAIALLGSRVKSTRQAAAQ